jgi:zinc/manganese transport system substrate-binding protein
VKNSQSKGAWRAAAGIVAAALAVTLSGCASQANPTPTPSSKRISIVASTSVWGKVAEAVGGDLVEVTSLIDSPNQDPHSYVATARDRLAVENADIVIMNGGGYDDFMQTLVDQDETPGVTVDAYQAAGDDQTRNEHIWYDFTQVQDVAAVIAAAIEAVDPSTYDAGQQNYDAFRHQLEALTALSKDMMNGLDNLDIVETEPIASYLLNSMGFNDVTPASFTKAVEEERDIPPLALKEVQDKIKYAQIGFMAMNPATSTAQTKALETQCKTDGVAVIYFSELPDTNQSYIDWMNANVQQVRKQTGVGQ